VSRVGAEPIPLPQGVEASLNGKEVQVKGPKGELLVSFDPAHLEVHLEEKVIKVQRRSEEKQTRAFHGLTRSLIANAITGVSEGFSKKLDVVGVGYRAEVQGRKLTLYLGYSHPVAYEAPEGIELSTEDAPGDVQTRIVIRGIDKQTVGQVAADIRFTRKPDPYKGKGVRYENEVIHFKAGKTAVT
jgi:large subunit ribosomal protein L6